MKEYALYSDSGFVAISDNPNIKVIEICTTCLKQGIIWGIHDDTIPHKGSPTFRPWKCTPQELRRLADEMEKHNEQ